jgi:hypothetical protein
MAINTKYWNFIAEMETAPDRRQWKKSCIVKNL